MGNAIKINPFVFLTPDAITSHPQANALADGLFTSVEIETGIGWMYKALSHEPESTAHGAAQPVHSFEAAYFDAMSNDLARTGDVLYVDEEGLFNNHNDCWIVIRGSWQPFAGAGLVVGSTTSGKSVAPKKVNVEWLKQNVIILCQNLIYIPRVGRLGVIRTGRAVQYATRNNLVNRDNPIWTKPNILI